MKKGKILIVEDSRIVAEDIKQKLIALGYTVSAVATSGKKALEAADLDVPDIAFMDIKLGEGMNGIDTAGELRKKYQVPVIYLTAYADEDTIERAKYTEPYGYLIKPFDDKVLQSAIEIALYKHQMERKLRVSEEWLHTALTSIGDGVIATDIEGRVTFINPVAESLTGWTKDEAAGKPLNVVFNIIDELTREPCENPATRVIKTGQVIGLANHALLVARGGREIPIKDSGSPIVLNGKEKLGVILVFQDDTERRKAEAERISLERRLQQAEKAESLGRMAGAVAHHFNNMLAATIGNLELMRKDLPPGTNLSQNLAEAQKGAQRVAEMSGHMLTYLGQSQGKPEAHDLAENCREQLAKLKTDLPEGVRLETDLPVPGPVINADTVQMRQVLRALFTNAMEAIEGSSGRVHVSVEKKKAEQIPEEQRFPKDWEAHEDVYACLTVRDTGRGMNTKTIGQIFDPFFTDKFTGRGLGLAVATGIVKAHGGGITVESTPGRGSTFRVFLPLTDEDILRTKETAVQSPQKVELSGTVLLVEDQDIVRKAARALLEHIGFDVLTAKDGDEAVEIFRAKLEDIRLVLTDLTMPGMNGWETLAALRAIRPDIPVILASGYDEAQARAGDQDEQPQAFLHKPFQLKLLKETIGKIFG